MSEYSEESGALDTDLLQVIHAWHHHGTLLDDGAFNHLALRLFAYQLRYNIPYARYCASAGITLHSLPQRWQDIPPLPTTAFKDAALATFEVSHAALRFQTSGTTQGRGGLHYMETRALYDAAVIAGFDRWILPDGARLRYFNLVPNPAEHHESSLGYMMAKVSADRGDEQTGWYIRDDELLTHAFTADLQAAIDERQAVCIAATAFALAALLGVFALSDERFTLPTGSRIMETGGFKGRARVVSREELYEKLAWRFGVQQHDIIAEYGMTELTTQYYDTVESRDQPRRVKASPPWLRSRVVDVAGNDAMPGIIGSLVHIDLANRSSALAISTEDLACAVDGGFVLLGRDEGAALRGCSLDAEDLRI